MITNDEFFKSMSQADWDKAGAIETEIGEILDQGFTEEVGIKFVRTVMSIRKVMPGATVGGVYDQALSAGLNYLSARVLKPATQKKARSTKTRVRGV